MKKVISILLLTALLLAGCSAPAAPVTTVTVTATSTTTVPATITTTITATPTVAPELQQKLDRLVEQLEAQRQTLHVPGMAIAVVKDDEVILTHGFGLADVESETPVTPETIFPIGSCTKAFFLASANVP